MSELIVFCNPGQVYRGRSELDVARAYTEMAITEYDRLVGFRSDYSDHAETPDFEYVTGRKGGRDLQLTLFARQPMIKVGNVNAPFTSSSYLFNPTIEHRDLLLPDLDIVQLDGPSQVRDAADAISEFYRDHGWTVHIFDGSVPKTTTVKPTSDRLGGSIEIYSPDVLREIAKERVGYDKDRLCF
ncbi:hypothetical protein ACFLQN_00595 [Candidatus Aenigmatarchaeota archaeon]